MARYEFIDAEKATMNGDGTRRYSVKQMCRWLKVSASGFHDWASRPMSATARRREELKPLIVKAFADSDGRHVHPDVVRDLMRELGPVACQPRRSPWDAPESATTTACPNRLTAPSRSNSSISHPSLRHEAGCAIHPALPQFP
jgi:hypothetical protein